MYIQGDLILLNVEKGFEKSKAAIYALLNRNPQYICIPQTDAIGNVIGLQGVWLPGDLLAELYDSGMWPVMWEDQNAAWRTAWGQG